MKAPTPESYWVTPRILAGKYPGARVERDAASKVAALLDAGVRTFVDLTEDDELLPYAYLLPPDVQHHRIAVRDVSCPTVEQVREALNGIARRQGCRVCPLSGWAAVGLASFSAAAWSSLA